MDHRIGDMAVGPDDAIYLSTSSYLWKVPAGTQQPVLLANLYFAYFNCFVYYVDYCSLNVDVDSYGYAFTIGRYPGNQGTSSMVMVGPDGSVLQNPIDLACTAFDVAVGQEGFVVAACKNGPVKKINPDGSVETLGKWKPMCEDFYAYTDPTGLAVLPDDSVLIADEKCNRVRKIMPDGTVTTLAGTGLSGFAGDGDAPLAGKLAKPADVEMGPDDVIYVADSGNGAIRTIEKVQGAVQLGAGQYGVPTSDGDLLVFDEKLAQLDERDLVTGVIARA